MSRGTSEFLLDFDGRDLVWLAVLGSLAKGPTRLKPILTRIEGLGGDMVTVNSVPAYLQEMERGGHINLVSDDIGWIVSMGENGPVALELLLGLEPSPHAPSQASAYLRLRQWIHGEMKNAVADKRTAWALKRPA